jgi:hypothetical protein
MKTTVKAVESGQKYELASRTVTGEEKCPGEAHENPHIDNCGICAPKWGVVPTYAPVDVVAATKAGYAVPYSWVTPEEATKPGGALEVEGVEVVEVEQKTKYGKSWFYAFVAKGGA